MDPIDRAVGFLLTDRYATESRLGRGGARTISLGAGDILEPWLAVFVARAADACERDGREAIGAYLNLMRPGTHIPAHEDSYAACVFFLTDSPAPLETDRAVFQTRRGELAFIPRGVPHGVRTLEGGDSRVTLAVLFSR